MDAKICPWLLKKPYMEHLIGFFVFFRQQIHSALLF